MNKEYYIKKLEDLEQIEEYSKNEEQNKICQELIAFLNYEITTDEDIIRESKSDTKRGILLRSILSKTDLKIIEAWEDASELPAEFKAAISNNIKKIDRDRLRGILNELVVQAEKPAIIPIIDKIKNNVFLTEEDIEVLYNAVISSKKFDTKDIESLLVLVDSINREGHELELSKEKKYHNGIAENSIDVQNGIRERLREIFERYNFTWEIYPDGKKWFVLTDKDEIIDRIKKRYDSKKEIIKTDKVDNLKCRYEEYINYIARYGNIESIEIMLEYLNSKGILGKVCFEGEVLAKTLVLTKTEEIDNLIEAIRSHTSEQTEEAAVDFIGRSPTLLFKSSPSLGSKAIDVRNKISSKSVSGSMTTFMETLSVLDENGINIDLSQKGLSLINVSTEKIRRNIETLKLYDMPLTEDDSLTSIISTNPGRLIDLSIESDSYDYIRANLSRTISTHFNTSNFNRGRIPNEALPYVLKYYQKRVDDVTYKKLWDSPKKRLDSQELIRACPFMSLDEIFEAYGKVKVKLDSNLEETFDSIIAAGDNTELYDFKDDDYIRAFDEKFRCEGNDLAYKFGDVLISRYKFLRYYNTLINKYYLENADTINIAYDESEIKRDILLHALTKDSMLDKSELTTIVNSIDSFEKAKSKKRD